jgi:hypothetical protein
MMLGVIPVSFRFRGRTSRLMDIYHCFREHPDVGLHPTQISRYTGIGFAEVNKCLESTPELFVKLPKRPDGITRYRLTTSTAARSPEEVEDLVMAGARKESLLLYATGSMLVCLMVIVAILVAPAV